MGLYSNFLNAERSEPEGLSREGSTTGFPWMRRAHVHWSPAMLLSLGRAGPSGYWSKALGALWCGHSLHVTPLAFHVGNAQVLLRGLPIILKLKRLSVKLNQTCTGTGGMCVRGCMIYVLQSATSFCVEFSLGCRDYGSGLRSMSRVQGLAKCKMIPLVEAKFVTHRGSGNATAMKEWGHR